MKLFLCVGLAAFLLAGCPEGWISGLDEWAPLVSLQVTETQDPAAFDRIISELRARGIKATILVDADFTTQNCERLRSAASEGFEIMAFARPEAAEGESVTLSMLSYEEQEELISGVKTAIETCLGESISGFRCYRFDQNEDTYRIVDSLGFQFNLGFVSQTNSSFPGHESDTLPYRAPGYDFWAVPMHSVYTNGQWAAFCDMPFSSLDGSAWAALLKRELDDMARRRSPLLVEVHPYYSGVDEERFEAFVAFLDYAQAQNARFITIAGLAAWSESQGVAGSPGTGASCACGED